MTPEELIKKYPRLFPNGVCVCGITIGPGWMSIVDQLCEDIMKICGDDAPQVLQIKEKFGGLRFYVGPCDDDVDKLIDASEIRCSETCEECGARGKSRSVNRYWVRTLCEDCEKRIR